MSDYSECGTFSDDVDSDTETYLYAKLHYEWEMSEMEHGLELRNNLATTVTNNSPIRYNEDDVTDRKPTKRQKIDKIITKIIEKVELHCGSDNDEEFSKYSQTCKNTSTEVKHKQECIQIVELSSDSDSDCIVLNDHNATLQANGNVLTTLENTLGAQSVSNNVKSLKPKKKKSKKKKKKKKNKKAAEKTEDIKKSVQETCKSIPQENLDPKMSTEANEIFDPFAKSLGNPMSYVEKMQRFYDSDCSVMDDGELDRLMKGCKKIKTTKFTRQSVRLNGRYFGSVRGVRCENCRQWDHTFEDCPEPLKKLTCYLCGNIGHYAAECPKICCGICFQNGHSSWNCHNALSRYKMICSLCKCVGHSSKECPDLWRRYYLTTKPGQLVEGDPRKLRKSSEMHCCNCGRKGHYVFDCTRYKMKPAYHPIWPFIIEYNDPNHHVSNNSGEKKSRRRKDKKRSKRGQYNESAELIKEAQFLRKKKSSHRSLKSKKNMYKNIDYTMKMRR